MYQAELLCLDATDRYKLYLYHDCLNGPIRLIYSRLSLKHLFTYLLGYNYSPVSDFFMATIQIGVIVQVPYLLD